MHNAALDSQKQVSMCVGIMSLILRTHVLFPMPLSHMHRDPAGAPGVCERAAAGAALSWCDP